VNNRLEKSKGLGIRMALSLFSAALLVRLIYLFEIQSLAFTHHLSLDAASYDRLGRAIAGGDWMGSRIFYQAPLYPYFLALVYKAFGHHLNLVRLIQLILGAFNCVVVAWMARKLFDRKTAFWSGCLIAGYGILLFYEGTIGKDGISVLLTDLALLGLVWSLERRVWFGWLFSGAVLGGSILTRGNLLLLVPLIILWIVVVLRKEPSRRIVGAVGALLAGIALFIFPVTLRNYLVGGDFVLTTAQAGQNFYIGNNPRASGFFENPKNIRLNPAYEEADFKAEALRRTGRKEMKPSEISSYWFREGLRFVGTHPDRALKLLLMKTAMFWNDFEIPDNTNYYFVRKEVLVLRILFLNFGIVAPLGLFGLFLARKSPGVWLFILFIFGYMISIVMFHVASRYRLPIVPVLIVFAGHVVARALDALRARRFSRLALGLVSVAAMAVFMNWKVVDEKGTFKAPLTDLGIIAAEAGDFEKALAYFDEALDIDPGYAPALYNKGNALAGQKQFDKAAAAYRKALERDPEFLMAYENLGKSYIRTGQFEEALKTFDKALRRRPDFVEALVGKGIVYHGLGEYERAIRVYREALAVQPDLASGHYNLACALARQGELEKAREALKRAIELNPAYEQKATTDPDLENVR
jgi:tetratricopeptide (TPR) repeat protein